MQGSKAVLAGAMMFLIALAGCTGGSDTLSFRVTPSDDPVTEPFLFEAIGPKYDHYTWDFGDGFGAEGAEVEHLFGFTNGDIIVRLTGQNEGEEPVTVALKVELGGTRNVNPIGVMTASTFWIDPGEVVTISAEGSSDSDNDPLLYRWTCTRIGDLAPPDQSHTPPESVKDLGVPFGVDEWSSEDGNLTSRITGDIVDLGDDLCSALNITSERPPSKEDVNIQGTITEPGRYTIELFVRDPKDGAPWIGRMPLYVSDPDRLKPEPTFGLTIPEQELQGGSGGQLQGVYSDNQSIPVGDEDSVEAPAPSTVGGNQTFDYYSQRFFMVMPSLTGEITFSAEGDGEVTWHIEDDDGDVAVQARQEGFTLSKDTLRIESDGSPKEYYVVFQVTQGAQMTVSWDMQGTHDINPFNWYIEAS